MKWRAHRNPDGEVDKLVVISDSHTILKVTDNLFICFRKAKPQAFIIGRLSTPALAKQYCEEDYEGKEFPPDTVDTYPEGRPTLDSQAGPGESPAGGTTPPPVP